MTTQGPLKPSRKQQLFKRKTGGPDAKRKKLFNLAHLLEVQEKSQPQPFLKTGLGKLPPELRVIIYQYLVVATPWSEAGSEYSLKNPYINQSRRFIHLRGSSLSILRVCRQINLEARPIFFANNIPYLANARELLGFLTSIGPTGRLQLAYFRIGGLVSRESRPDVPDVPGDTSVFYLGSQNRIAQGHGKVDPDVRSAFSFLVECKRLQTIYMEMKQGEEPAHFDLLRTFVDRLYTQLLSIGLCFWSVRRSDELLFATERPAFRNLKRTYRTLISSGQPMGRNVLVMVDMNPPAFPAPFYATYLGRLPYEVRNQIYRELVAIPPTHTRQGLITQGIRVETRDVYGPVTPRAPFTHLQSSHFAILRVCRSIYDQARPIFYQRKSYYTNGAEEFEQLARLSACTFFSSRFDCTRVTSLCVRDVVSWSDRKGYCLDNRTLVSVFQLEGWKSLRKIYFCMRVGEELGYLEFLFLLPGMSRGTVEFLDDSHWVVVDQQDPYEEWQFQYACFETNVLSYRKGKNGEELSDGNVQTIRKNLKAQSAAMGLNDGDERYVEVKIGTVFDNIFGRFLMRDLTERFSSLSLDEQPCWSYRPAGSTFKRGMFDTAV